MPSAAALPLARPVEQDELLSDWCSSRDRDARRRLIERHLPLVRSLARRYAHRGEQLEDLVQVGAVGLIKAIDRYQPGRGSSLAAYAVPTILGEIRRHLRDSAQPVRVPRARWETGAVVHSVPFDPERSAACDEAAEHGLEQGEDRALLEASLRTLAWREREIVRLRYFGGLSQRGIAAQLGISQVHVSRLLARSLRTLRQEIGRTEA
jgi:RNA polymerase sigma-B factor